MIALDFISLLLSKDTPVQASLSISPALRETVALGTIGADKVTETKVTRAQKLDNAMVSKGWKLQSLNENADSILASAAKLEKEIEAETRYWQQVVEVSDKGWAVCRLPQEKFTLGVRFGFSECWLPRLLYSNFTDYSQQLLQLSKIVAWLRSDVTVTDPYILTRE